MRAAEIAVENPVAAATVPPELVEIAARVKSGETPSIPVRTILSWFRAKRRGTWIVFEVQGALGVLGLGTDPPFTFPHIDGSVTFKPLNLLFSKQSESSEPSAEFDPSYRVSRLKAASNVPLSVKPDQSLEIAVTFMIKNDFSQLPVMTTERELKGVVSWKSIGTRLAMGAKCEFVRDCLDPSYAVNLDDHIFKVIALVAENDCVMVRNSDRIICGLITTSDLGLQFQQWAEPFLLLGEIENHVRRRIDKCFSMEEIRSAKNPDDIDRDVEHAHHLTFGEYVKLLENRDRWTKLGLKIAREDFIADLIRINEIRNSVMHFDPDGIDDEELESLRKFRAFLERLEVVSPC